MPQRCADALDPLALALQVQPRRYLKKLPLQANFYPMPVMAYIQDMQNRLTLHTAQALGVSSLRDGEWGTGAVPSKTRQRSPCLAPRPLLSASLSSVHWRKAGTCDLCPGAGQLRRPLGGGSPQEASGHWKVILK